MTIKVDGFGGLVSEQGVETIARDLTALGVPAEALGVLRRSEPGAKRGSRFWPPQRPGGASSSRSW